MVAMDERIIAQLTGQVVSYRELVRFMFKSGEVRLHPGFGAFVDGSGERWEGLDGLGQMSAISAGPGQPIEEMLFSLTATAGMLATLESDADEAAGREVFRYAQFCDPSTYAPISTAFQTFWGKMGALKVDRPKVDSGNPNGAQRIITVSAVNAFVNRRKPPFGFFSHRDQQARTDGTDNIFINASRMANATAVWPTGLS